MGKSVMRVSTDDDESNWISSQTDDARGQGFSALPIMIIVMAIIGLLLMGVIFFVLRKKHGRSNYRATAREVEPRVALAANV